MGLFIIYQLAALIAQTHFYKKSFDLAAKGLNIAYGNISQNRSLEFLNHILLYKIYRNHFLHNVK